MIYHNFTIDTENWRQYNFYFIGILGSGMSALARFTRLSGAAVSGSDRNYTNFNKPETAVELESIGCKIFMQNGSHLEKNINFAVVSTAIEKENDDIKKALELNIPVIHRADLLSYIVNKNFGIAVGGTSGKSTTTGIIGYLLRKSGLSCGIISGAGIKGIGDSGETLNCISGDSGKIVIECDESDGSIVKFSPEFSIITNITKDHKTIDELKILFQEFIDNTKNTVFINNEDPILSTLNFNGKKIIRIGNSNSSDYRISDIELNKLSSSFKISGQDYKINAPGIYNVYNAAFAVAVASELGIEYEKIKNAILNFSGVSDRFDIFRRENPAVVFDYAHNPAKIDALLQHTVKFYSRILFVFQPHGYQPTFFLKDEFYRVFTRYFLEPEKKIMLKPIYYAGGTVEKKITSEQMCSELNKLEVNATYADSDEFILKYISNNKDMFDIIVIAGARDRNLKNLCNSIAEI